MENTNNKSVFIYNLTWATFLRFLVEGNKPDKLYYFSEKIGLRLMKLIGLRITTAQVCLTRLSQPHLKSERDRYLYTEELFKHPEFFNEAYKMLSVLNLETDKLITSLKKYVITYVIRDDIKVIASTQVAAGDQDCECIVNEYKLFKDIISEDINISRVSSFDRFMKEFLFFGWTMYKCLKQIVLFKSNMRLDNFGKINFVFDQMYRGQERNPEFPSFYRYFKLRDEVLYICVDRESDIYKTLKADRKPVLVRGEINVSSKMKAKQICAFIKLLFRLLFSAKLKSIEVKRSILEIFNAHLYYESIFEHFKPLYYLKTRFDYGPSHPVATAVSDKYGVKHIGYQHGTYSFFEAAYSHIDYHYFGLNGRYFKENTYSEFWPQDINYLVLGPYFAESVDRDYSKDSNKHDKFIVSIMTNPKRGRQFANFSYEKSVALICSTLKSLSISNLHIIFKEKNYQDWSERIIIDLCERYDLSYEIAYHRHPINVKHEYPKEVIRMAERDGMDIHLRPSKVIASCSSEEVISMSDIVIVVSPGYSTVSFEALGQKKKIIVFMQKDVPKHPFEEFLPKLTPKDQKEFEDSMKWMIGISQEDYEECIQPVLDNCSKFSDGNLIRDFIESIIARNT